MVARPLPPKSDPLAVLKKLLDGVKPVKGGLIGSPFTNPGNFEVSGELKLMKIKRYGYKLTTRSGQVVDYDEPIVSWCKREACDRVRDIWDYCSPHDLTREVSVWLLDD